MNFWVYIMTNKPNGTLYTGYTDDLYRRVYEHKQAIRPCFTQKYKLFNLAYYEPYDTREQAKQREANIKAWKRDWKINLIKTINPHWTDLAAHLNDALSTPSPLLGEALSTLTPLFPAQAGTHFAESANVQMRAPWTPACAGKGGGGR